MSAECEETDLDPDSQESDSRDDMPCTGVHAAYPRRSPADVRKELKAALFCQDLSARRIAMMSLCFLEAALLAVLLASNLEVPNQLGTVPASVYFPPGV